MSMNGLLVLTTILFALAMLMLGEALHKKGAVWGFWSGLISCAVTWYVLEYPDRASELARNLLGLAYGLLSFGVVIYLFFCPSFFERKDSHGCEGPGNS